MVCLHNKNSYAHETLCVCLIFYFIFFSLNVLSFSFVSAKPNENICSHTARLSVCLTDCPMGFCVRVCACSAYTIAHGILILISDLLKFRLSAGGH